MRLFILNKPGKTLFLLIFLVYFGCGKEQAIETDFLEVSQQVKTITKQQLSQMVDDNGLDPVLKLFLLYDIKAIRIEYKTVGVDGEVITASGALYIPDTSTSLPLLSFQHGTIFEQEEAPSVFEAGYLEAVAIFASTGYNIALPDYIGYGASAYLDHPYEHRQSLASSTRDMIRATYEYEAITPGVTFTNHLFLSGYSEGGFATMATLKMIQDHHQNEFNITAATVGSGAYNKTAFANWIFNADEELQHLNSFIWVIDVYNNIYEQLGRPYSHYFNEPWASLIEQHGALTPIELNPSLLFKESFLQDMKDGTDTEMFAALADNDCFDWKPEFPLQLYHGDADVYVPYFNSETAHQAMMAQGATNVGLITVIDGTHQTTVIEYLFGTFNYFADITGKKMKLEPENSKAPKFFSLVGQ